MKIKSVEINNFLIIGKAKLSLDDRGLVLVQGENLDDDSANSNGAGKSSLVDAISWCLYGVTARGVTGDEVINNVAKKNCVVSVEVDDDGVLYQINRFRKHKDGKNNLNVIAGDGSELTRGTTKLTQEMIEKIIGCSADVFNSAVYAGQEQMPDLPGMTDKQLKVLIEEAAGIEKFQAAHMLAQQKLRASESERDSVESKVATLNDRVNSETVKHSDAVDSQSTWNIENGSKIKAKEASVETFDSQEVSVEREMAADCRGKEFIERDVESLAKKLDEKAAGEEKLAELQKYVAKKEKRATEIGFDIKIATDSAKKNKAKVGEANGIVGTPCDECGKKYEESDLVEVLEATNKRLRESLISLKRSKDALKVAEEQLSDARSELKKFSDSMIDLSEFTALNDAYSAELKKVAQYEARLKKIDVSRQRVRAEIESSKAAGNPYDILIKTLGDEVNALVKERRVIIDNDLPDAEAKVELLQDAVDVFGRSGVRAHILDTVTPFLNEKTGDYLSALTDGSITANWSTISTTAKGELREKFGIHVEKVNGAKKFKGLSGGEKRKVRISTSMALQDLVASRAAKPINLFLGDELDDALDVSGLERLMDILTQKAKEKGTVLIISHNNLGDWCTNAITVTNSKGVSTISGAV